MPSLLKNKRKTVDGRTSMENLSTIPQAFKRPTRAVAQRDDQPRRNHLQGLSIGGNLPKKSDEEWCTERKEIISAHEQFIRSILSKPFKIPHPFWQCSG